MSKRKYKRQVNTGTKQTGLVRLSQCMIVKNEERNIEKALSWGKNIVCEQIVVDTGSTDRTIEIAERMGAKVLHFEWINDFAAAKNFAIEQASGNWVAFLDADEYITEEDIGIVIPFLETIMNDDRMRKNYLAVCCPWIQLNDKGQPKEVLEQERIFQNLPNIRYVGKIHEKLSLVQKDIVATYDFRIMHTGYTEESFMATGKATRNIELLRADLEENPDDMRIKAYLAESLRAEASVKGRETDGPEEAAAIKAKYDEEIDKLYLEVLESNADIPPLLKKSTYEYFLRAYTTHGQIDNKIDKLCEKAYKEFPKDTKFMCYYAMSLNKNGRHSEAYEVLKKCEEALEKSLGTSSALTTKVMGLFTAQMVLTAQGLGDTDSMLKYAEIMLLMDKNNMGVLRPYIVTLMGRFEHIDDVLGVLARTYDMSSKRDLLTIARAAKDCGALGLARQIVDVAAYLGDG